MVIDAADVALPPPQPSSKVLYARTLPEYTCGWGLEPRRRICQAPSRHRGILVLAASSTLKGFLKLVLASNERRTLLPVMHP